MLCRVGYYTIPPLEELGRMVGEDGACLVENFTVGRKGEPASNPQPRGMSSVSSSSSYSFLCLCFSSVYAAVSAGSRAVVPVGGQLRP